MGYRAPKAVLLSTDVPDPRYVREAISPIVEEVGGRLNEHNVEAGTLASNRRSTAMLYDFHYASVDADPHIATAANPCTPDAVDVDAWRVPDGGDWEVVGSMTVSYVAGEHVAWCIGWCFYGIVMGGTTNFNIEEQTNNKPRVQFALRVNGTVLEETITGTERPDEGAPRTVRPIVPVTSTGFAPPTVHEMRSLDYESSRPTGSFGWHVRAVRIQCQVPVPAGTTSVELVARRTVNVMRYVGSTIPSVYVYNRKIISIEMKNGDTNPGAGQAVNVTYPVEGQALNTVNIYTNVQAPVVTAINDLGMDAVQRYGLRQEHLPSGYAQIRDFADTRFTTGNNTARVWPGWGSDGTVGVGQWDIVNDGAGNNLTATVNWDFSANPGFVLILGNVAHRRAQGTGNRPDRYGVYSTATLYANGTYSMNQSAQCWINNPNVYLYGAEVSNLCDTDVPTLEFYDYRAAPPANGTVTSFRINVAAANTTSVGWEHSSIFAIIFAP